MLQVDIHSFTGIEIRTNVHLSAGQVTVSGCLVRKCFRLSKKLCTDQWRAKFRKNKHNIKTNSAALCNRLLLFIIKCTIAYYSVCARVYKKTDVVSF